jgi:fatty acid synthase
LLGYSFGALLALEVALELEAEGREGRLYLVDGAPDFTKSMFQYIMGTNEEQFETNFMCAIYKVIAPHEATSEAVRKVFHVRNIKP